MGSIDPARLRDLNRHLNLPVDIILETGKNRITKFFGEFNFKLPDQHYKMLQNLEINKKELQKEVEGALKDAREAMKANRKLYEGALKSAGKSAPPEEPDPAPKPQPDEQ